MNNQSVSVDQRESVEDESFFKKLDLESKKLRSRAKIMIAELKALKGRNLSGLGGLESHLNRIVDTKIEHMDKAINELTGFFAQFHAGILKELEAKSEVEKTTIIDRKDFEKILRNFNGLTNEAVSLSKRAFELSKEK